MSDTIVLNASKRSDEGKGASRRLRREQGLMPAIIYGGKGDRAPLSISIPHKDMIKAQEAEAFYSQILDLVIDGKTEQVTLKALQRHPSRPVILHADFQRVVADKIMNTMIQLHFINEDNAPGVREGGQVTHIMTEVEISCLPGDLPEYIEVDLGNLEMDQTLHLSELKVPAGVEIRLLAQHADDVNASDHDHGVAAIHMPKAAASEEAGDTGAEAGAAEG